MLKLSKITLLLLASIGLTACGALGSLINEINAANEDCPSCEFYENEQLALPPDVHVNADIFKVPFTRGHVQTNSGIIEDIENYNDELTYGKMTLNNAEGGFAYFTDATGGFEYVGILDDTDLGNALHFGLRKSPTVMVTWDATIVVILEGTPQTRTFPLEIDFYRLVFTGDNIEFDPVSSGAGPRIGSLSGGFNIAGASNAGQITGSFNIAGEDNHAADMYGLIGEDGAVGVFYGSYLGGFVAEPQ